MTLCFDLEFNLSIEFWLSRVLDPEHSIGGRSTVVTMAFLDELNREPYLDETIH